MSRYSKIYKARNSWRQKATSRAEEIRYLRRELKRIKKERDHLKKWAKSRKKEKQNQKNLPEVTTKQKLIFLAFQLFLVASVSFRAVSRILAILSPYIGFKKAPSPQTIINWVNRLSIARMQNIPQRHMESGSVLNASIWLLDLSIALSEGKILAVLSMRAGHHDQNAAPKLNDTDCVGVKVATSWKGQDIADFLEKIINKLGAPSALLMDGGTDLAKAVTLLHGKGYSFPVIADISHVIANALKHAYANHPKFDILTSACSQASGKMKQTVLACLAPPKVSTKGRFMNIHRLVRWAHQLLQHSPKGQAAKGSILSKLRSCLGQLPECRPLIKKFQNDASSLLQCQKILKEEGLSNKTVQKCQSYIRCIEASSVRNEIEAWLQVHLKVAENLGLEEIGLPVSTDPIESLYGRAKSHGTGEVKDANRIALRIPALCRAPSQVEAQKVLEVSCAQEKGVTGALSSLTKQRQKVLPAPGSLETLSDTKTDLLELIPSSKKRSKSKKNALMSEGYTSRDGPDTYIECQLANGVIAA